MTERNRHGIEIETWGMRAFIAIAIATAAFIAITAMGAAR